MKKLKILKFKIEGKIVLDFDEGMNILLEEHSTKNTDPIAEFYNTADVNFFQKIPFNFFPTKFFDNF